MSATSSPPTYVLRLAKTEDFEALKAFYHQNKHQNVKTRLDDAYQNAIARGGVTLIIAPDQEIRGSSITWPYLENQFTEIGSTRFTVPGGFPLYPLIISLQSLDIAIRKTPKDRIVAFVDYAGRRVAEKLTSEPLLFSLWPDYHAFAKAKAEIIVGTAEECNYYQSGISQLPHQARHVLSVLQNPLLTSKNGNTMHIDMSALPIVAEHSELLAELAAHNWDNITQETPLGGWQARMLWADGRASLTQTPASQAVTHDTATVKHIPPVQRP